MSHAVRARHRLDTGKAIAALLTNGGDPLDYLEVIGRCRALTQPSAPYIAIPTTAGPGAEVTRNAVLASPEHHVKIEWIASLCADLGIPPLSGYGVTAAEIPALVAETKNASSTKGNPIALQDGELAETLRQAL